jgi:hypothetical protein
LLLSDLKANGQVLLTDANIGGHLDLSGATLTDRTDHLALHARHLRVAGDLDFGHGFTAEGNVDLSYARVDQSLFLSGHFSEPEGVALMAQAITVSHDIYGQTFTAQGEVILQRARIGNNLNFNGSRFVNKRGTALSLEEARVGADLDLKGTFTGKVVLGLTQIGGELYAQQATFDNAGGVAIDARQITVTGDILLNNATIHGPMFLNNAHIGGNLDAIGASIIGGSIRISDPRITLQRVSLFASGATVDGSIMLIGFHGDGTVFLPQVTVGGVFNASNARLKGAGGDVGVLFSGAIHSVGAVALVASYSSFSSDIYLNGITTQGSVLFDHSHIAGNLFSLRGRFTNTAYAPLSNRLRSQTPLGALNVSDATVQGCIVLEDEFRADGGVDLYNTRLGCVEAADALFANSHGPALDLTNADVRGSVSLNNGVTTHNAVSLHDASVQGDLDITAAALRSGSLLDAAGLTVKGAFVWMNLPPDRSVVIDLDHAHVGTLVDQVSSWPSRGNLYLDGFIYGRIASRSPKDAPTRLSWLNLQNRDNGFIAQPYSQLAGVLRDNGDEDGSKQVHVAMENARREHARLDRTARLEGYILWRTIGYGYYPFQALWGVAGFILCGYLLFKFGYMANAMVPCNDEHAYAYFVANGEPPPYYPSFSPLLFSIDSFLPILNLSRHTVYWIPNHNRTLGVVRRTLGLWLHLWLYIQIIAGWVITTLFVLGLTGIIRGM